MIKNMSIYFKCEQKYLSKVSCSNFFPDPLFAVRFCSGSCDGGGWGWLVGVVVVGSVWVWRWLVVVCSKNGAARSCCGAGVYSLDHEDNYQNRSPWSPSLVLAYHALHNGDLMISSIHDHTLSNFIVIKLKSLLWNQYIQTSNIGSNKTKV